MAEDTLFYESIEVDGLANNEVVETVLTSTKEEKKTVIGVWIAETTAAENNDADIVLYIEREKIADIPIKVMLDIHDVAGARRRDRWIKLGHSLPEGDTLKVGQVSGAVATNITFTVAYEID